MQQQRETIKGFESVWLLRILTGMVSFIGFVLFTFFNTMMKRMDEFSQFKLDVTKTLAENQIWISTFDNSQKRLEQNVDMMYEKLYANKPDEIKIKRQR